MSVASIEEINSFLLQAKKAISTKQFAFEERQKNLQTLADHGWTIDDVSSTIEALTYQDYHTGPKPDKNKNYGGEFWEFGYNLGGVELYIKLKLTIGFTGQGILCLSFHEQEFRFTYPYKSTT